MKLVYIDESGTFNDTKSKAELLSDKRLSTHFLLSALIVDLDEWKNVFNRYKKLRKDIKRNFQVSLGDHIHANELMNGTKIWKNEKYKHLNSKKRATLLKYLLNEYTQWQEISLITVVADKFPQSSFPTINPQTVRNLTIENLLNRLSKTYPDHQLMLIMDGQEDNDVIKQVRKLQIFNYVPGGGGRQAYNYKIENMVEDPLFKSSRNSYFLQAVDHIAYSTLHLFDERLDKMVGKGLLQAKIYNTRGVAAVHRPTRDILPGVVTIPKLKTEEIKEKITRALA